MEKIKEFSIRRIWNLKSIKLPHEGLKPDGNIERLRENSHEGSNAFCNVFLATTVEENQP